MARYTIIAFCVSLIFSGAMWGRSPSDQKPAAESAKKLTPSEGHLVMTQRIPLPSEIAGGIDQPLVCDEDGNIYLQSEHHGIDGVRKLSPKGQRVAVFQPNANPGLPIDLVDYFALDENGELYQLVFPHEVTRYVFVFKPDGTYKSSIKLQPGFAWQPSTLAVFPSGNMLISGLKYDPDRTNRAMLPFTGIFGSDGTLLKEVKLEDDDAIHDLAQAGDSRVSSSTNPRANHAIEFSEMQTGADGNIYLMRWLAPAIFYAISPGGETIRRFTVDPGDQEFHPEAMHISGNRIAVLFYQPQRKESRMKVVDLEGQEIATYDSIQSEGKAKPQPLGLSFACYTAAPERFIFLGSGEDDKLEFTIAEPR